MKDSKCETIHTTNFIELIQTACLGPQQIHEMWIIKNSF